MKRPAMIFLILAAVIIPASAQFAPGQLLTANALNAALAQPTIVGGTINGAPIGLVAPAAGVFTNLQATNSLVSASATFNTLTLNGVGVGILTATTGSIGGANLAAGACASSTAAVSGATNAMVANASPATYPGDAVVWKSYITPTNVVNVKVCALVSATPTASTYTIRVIQ